MPRLPANAPAPDESSSPPAGPFDLWRRRAGLLLGPLIALGVALAPLPSLTGPAHALAAILALVVIFWLTEAIPIPATALLGAALAIICGVAPAQTTLAAFGDPILFLFIGSFMIARAMQVHGLDRRFAYALLMHPWVGGSTWRTLWALGATAFLLAMWMGITGAAAMLFPVAIAIARVTGELTGAHAGPFGPRRYATALLLTLTYAASAGAMATPIGTPPNLIGVALIREAWGIQLGFLQWMAFGVPIALALWITRFGLLLAMFPPEVRMVPGQRERLQEFYRALGPWTRGERHSLVVFVTAVALWIGPGLAALALPPQHPLVAFLSAHVGPGTAALLATSLLFIPIEWRTGDSTLTWREAASIDWGTIMLFGGGLALGRLMDQTGLAATLGGSLLESLSAGGSMAVIGGAAVVSMLLSEATSNTAAANMVLPVVLSMASGGTALGLAVALSATLGASLGFMLPVSTPANAIIYGSGAIRFLDMVRAGILVDIAGALVVWAACAWLIPVIV